MITQDTENFDEELESLASWFHQYLILHHSPGGYYLLLGGFVAFYLFYYLSILCSLFKSLIRYYNPNGSAILSFLPDPKDFQKQRCFHSDVSGLIIFYGQILTFIAGIYGWSRDLVRETIKKCNMVSVNVFIFGFTPFVISESILFISIFWGLIHFISSPFFNFQESLFLPDPCELTYGNTLLLSNAAVSLGSAYSTRENLILFGTPNSLSFILACIFLSLQIKEFKNLGFYINDSVYGSIFFILSGLHFLHVIVGLMFLGIYSNFPETFDSYFQFISFPGSKLDSEMPYETAPKLTQSSKIQTASRRSQPSSRNHF